MESCNCQSQKSILIYACSGAADVGELSDKVARKLRSLDVGKMFCLGAIGAQLNGYLESAMGADRNIVIDGCPTACGKKCFDNAGIEADTYILTEMGFEKGKTEITDRAVRLITDQIVQRLEQ